MTTLPYITLNTDWRCDYFEIEPSLYEFMDGIDVPVLQAWAFDRRMTEGWGAWLQRKFDVPPIENVCVNFMLNIKRVPTGAQLIINGRDFGIISAPFSFDVTDYITLEDNIIAFLVPCEASGSFGDVRLRVVPCG
jgi:hypothetical protein